MEILRVVVVTKSGEWAGGANTYEAAVLRLLHRLSTDHAISVEIVSPQGVPGAEGEVGVASSHRYSNTTLAKARSVFASTFLGKLLSRFVPLSPLDRPLRFLRPDIVYFPSPNIHALGIGRQSFFFTVWDLGHRELRQFPEFADPIEHWLRERLFRLVLPRATTTFTDSMWTGAQLEKSYGLPGEKWTSLGMAFTVPGEGLPQADPSQTPTFVYPAQKWPHKNHTTLLRAFARVVQERPNARLILTGSAKAGGEAVSALIRELGLEASVDDRGFVSQQEALTLMASATAVVMPSYLGPTNLPPLEAAAMGVRSIVSDVHHFDEPLGSYLTIVPAGDVGAWAQHMLGSIGLPALPPWTSSSQAEIALRNALKTLRLG